MGQSCRSCFRCDKIREYGIYVAPKRSHGGLWGAYPKTIEPPYHPVYSEKTWAEGGWSDIDPLDSYRALFNGDLYVVENPELIFSRGDNQLNDEYGIQSMTRHQMPVSKGGGWNCHGITGKQCDAYGMNDGKPFDRATSMKGFTQGGWRVSIFEKRCMVGICKQRTAFLRIGCF